MRFSLSTAGLQDWNGDVLVVGLLQDQPATDLEARFPGLGAALAQQQFKGKPSEQLLINRLGNDGPQRLVVLGLGPANAFNLDGVRSAAARAAKAASGHTGSLGLQLSWDGLEPAAAAAAAAEAARLALYADQRFRKAPEPRRHPEALELIGLPATAAAGLEAVDATCAGVELARELVAAPPNVVTPAALAETAAELSRNHGLELTVLERAECEARGMGAFLCVSQGSDLDPKLIHLMLDTVFVVDAEHRILFVSDACESLLGYRADELIGTLITRYMHPEDVAMTHASIKRVMNGQPHLDFRNRYLHKSGSVVHILWSARWSEEEQVRIGVARDITPRADGRTDGRENQAKAAAEFVGLAAHASTASSRMASARMTFSSSLPVSMVRKAVPRPPQTVPATRRNITRAPKVEPYDAR